jgi:hypothetical protein
VSGYVETPVAVVVVLPVGLAEPVGDPVEPVDVLVELVELLVEFAAKVAYLPPCIRHVYMNGSVGVIYAATLRVLTSRDDG